MGLENLTLKLIFIIWCDGKCLPSKATCCKFKSINQPLHKIGGLGCLPQPSHSLTPQKWDFCAHVLPLYIGRQCLRDTQYQVG